VKTVSTFILSLPKAELHLHLEGTVEPQTLIELSRKYDHDPLTPETVAQLYSYCDFQGFLMAFKAVTERLRTPEDYELITYRMMERLRAQNVLHAEVYCSVGVCLMRKMDFGAIFAGMERGRERGERDFGVSVLWLFDSVRQFGIEQAEAVVDLAIKYRERNVAGFGIGGDERRGPPEMFRATFARAKAAGLHLTCHAGETAGPESIWGAINLGAERLGHALTAFQDEELMHVLAEQQIALELCPASNLRTRAIASLDRHPLRVYFDRGLMVTLNSDDPAMFATSLVEEYSLAQQHFGLSDEHLREVARNSFEASFLPAEQKLKFFDLIDAHAHSELA
jgi:adenosine deaminase/aminodeoxyfutalosine deaminase